MELIEMLSSPLGMAALTTVVTGWLINAFDVPKKSFFGIVKLRQLIALLIGAVLVLGTHFVGEGFAADYSGIDLYGWAIGVGLFANGIANVDLWKKLLKTIKAFNERK